MRGRGPTQPFWVRCIKPNENMAPLVFDAPLVMRQLRYAGVFEAVAIRKQGYPFRLNFSAFAFRYRCSNGEWSCIRRLFPHGNSAHGGC